MAHHDTNEKCDTNIEQNDDNGSGLGNTRTKPRRKRYRSYCFTLNNWDLDEYNDLIDTFRRKGWTYIIGKENGTEKGTPHLQGYVYHKNPIDWTALKKINNRLHIEVAKGNIEQNRKYCSKEGDYETNIKEPFEEMVKRMCLEKYKDIEWKEWQGDVIDIINNEGDDRTIHWYWEPKGNVGKTFLAKYICLTNDVIIADGKRDNIFNQVKKSLEDEKLPSIVILDIPRSSQGYINYSAIEKLKDGLMYSGKYEGGQCIFPSPKVIVFSNDQPNYREMSGDRWSVHRIED